MDNEYIKTYQNIINRKISKIHTEEENLNIFSKIKYFLKKEFIEIFLSKIENSIKFIGIKNPLIIGIPNVYLNSDIKINKLHFEKIDNEKWIIIINNETKLISKVKLKIIENDLKKKNICYSKSFLDKEGNITTYVIQNGQIQNTNGPAIIINNNNEITTIYIEKGIGIFGNGKVYEGNLNLNKSNMTIIPDNFTINGNLDISKSKIKKLPKNLTVNGDIFISEKIEIPEKSLETLNIKGKLKIIKQNISLYKKEKIIPIENNNDNMKY